MAPQQDIIIAIMGATGVGKSKIIDKLTQKTSWSGDSLASVTQSVRSIKTRVEGTEITLVDTPGFDDTHKSDLHVLHAISDWLEAKYRKGVCLSGLLYVQRISDNRLAGTAHHNLKMFGKLCGGEEEVGRKVVFVSTMWDKTAEDKGERREVELKKYWQPMIDLGARTARSNGSRESAQNIILDLLKAQTKYQSKNPVLIQEEIVTLNRSLVETEAAQALYTDIQKLLRQHKQTLTSLERAADRVDNPESAAQLQKQREAIESELAKTFEESRKLKIGWLRRFLRLFQKRARGVSGYPVLAEFCRLKRTCHSVDWLRAWWGKPVMEAR
ncbi:P-loop containing nucleoside triphosphate hydrolase protein [Crepidotus variabilis]|uniref:P-loop containing nucleoside triphosphate hydrolase protein n=1 Tax=Crepidotus variabilis TaxID=179855 RepID=A0A9P6JS56_9AGAR|nr:P-loop containing nucleoside triphosphate hydrolase protein [Crepidotus variabilis]